MNLFFSWMQTVVCLGFEEVLLAVESFLCLQCRFRNAFNQPNASRSFLWLVKTSPLIAKSTKTKCGLGGCKWGHAKSWFVCIRSDVSTLGTRTFFMAWHTQQEPSDERACGAYAVLPKVHGKLVGTDSPLAGCTVLRWVELSNCHLLQDTWAVRYLNPISVLLQCWQLLDPRTTIQRLRHWACTYRKE